MAQNPPKDMPRIIPMLSYEDVGEALEWLAGAFGFRERLRYAEPDGTITHAEMELADGVVMLAHPGTHYQSPRRHRAGCEPARRWSATPYVIDGVHVYVDDLDKHFRRAKEAGATILSEPEETPYGVRRYRAEDLEGHRWMFSQQVRDVEPEERPRRRPSSADGRAASFDEDHVTPFAALLADALPASHRPEAGPVVEGQAGLVLWEDPACTVQMGRARVAQANREDGLRAAGDGPAQR